MAVARALVLHLPAFRLERCGFDAGELAGLIDEVKNAMRLVAITPAGQSEGLRVGMTAAEARALVPTVQLLEHRPLEEAEDRTALIRTFDQLSDQVTFPWGDAIVMSANTVAHLHGGEVGLARRAVALAEELGHRARAVVACDPLLALALATWSVGDGGVRIVGPNEGAEVLSELPIEALRPPGELIADLRAVGVRTVGQFARLDPASVAGRYPQAIRLHRVANGQSGSLAQLHVRPEEGPLRVSAQLASAATVGELQFVLPELVQSLCLRLASRDLAAVRLRMVLHLEPQWGSTAHHAETLRVGRPTRAPVTLERLVRRRLEQVCLDAPMEQLLLEAVETVPDTGWQPGLATRTEATEPLPDLLARLADQLGDDALFAAVPADRWAPEAAWCPGPFPSPRLWASYEVSVGPGSDDPVEIQAAWEQGGPAPRPILLFEQPRRIPVEADHGVPREVRLGDRGVRQRGVARALGPEALSGAWWDPSEAFDREYWVVEIEGRDAWVFREDDRWFQHGWFD